MIRWSELRELTRHRTLQFLRQPEAVFWVFAFPLILAAVLGYAFKSGEAVPSVVAVVDDEEQVALVARLEADPLVEVERFADRELAEVQLRTGKVDALLVDATTTPPTLRLDPVRQEAEVARLRVLVAIGAIEADAIAIDEVTERGSRYVDFLYPGLLGMNLMGTGLWAIGFALGDLRQRKLLKRYLVTPMRRSSFLASFLMSRMQFLVLEVVLLTAFGFWVLGVPMRGSILQFAFLCFVSAVAFANLGVLAAARAKTIEGVSGMLNLIMMPMWLGSGVFFSYERFPEVLHPILRLLPLTALNDALRATMLEGAGIAAVGSELLVLAFWVVVPFAVGLRIFRWS